MKTVRIHQFGGELRIDDVPMPEPRRGEMLVKVRAASVNPVDAKIRDGKYPPIRADMLPYTLGRDIAGTVVKVGGDVAGFGVGTELCAFIDIARGGYAEYAIATPAESAPKPLGLDLVVAGAIPLAGITAWQGLFDHGELRQGQRVLIHGGAGGVGHFAIQFAKAYGAWVATTVSARDREFASALGADLVIDYTAELFEEKLHDLDLVYDLIAGETQDRSWQVLKRGGTLVSTLTQPSAEKAKAHGVRGVRYTAQPQGTELADIGKLVGEGKVKITVSKTFPLSEARAAQDFLQNEHVRGKVVLLAA